MKNQHGRELYTGQRKARAQSKIETKERVRDVSDDEQGLELEKR